jgi:nitroreductase
MRRRATGRKAAGGFPSASMRATTEEQRSALERKENLVMATEKANPVIKAIKSRRAVRSYESRPIPTKIVKEIIDAGNWAPSGGNLQPWRFVVVEDEKFRERLRQIAQPKWQKIWLKTDLSDHMKNLATDINTRCLGWPEDNFKEIHERMKTLKDSVYYEAPVIVFVISEGQYTAHDCPMVCLNMMLAAHSLGIGSNWVSHGLLGLQDEEVRRALDLEENEQVFGPILFGYPKLYPEPPKKKEPVIKWI